jgi:hypothetical protein
MKHRSFIFAIVSWAIAIQTELTAVANETQSPNFMLKSEIAIEPFGGVPFCADLNGDGRTDVLSLQSAGIFHSKVFGRQGVTQRDDGAERDHFCLTATDVHGKILWQIGKPWRGKRPFLTHCAERSIASADIDGDGKQEVVCIRGQELLVIDAASGKVERSAALPADNAQVVLLGHTGSKPADWTILVKNTERSYKPHEYANPAWWYDSKLQLLKTADYHGAGHVPLAMDTDGDGLDEFLIGFCLVDHDLRTLWTFQPVPADKWNAGDMHVDDHAAGLFDGKLCIAYAAGDLGTFLLDASDGRLLWKARGVHAQDCQVGRFLPGSDANQVFVRNKRSYNQLFDGRGKELWRTEPPDSFPLGRAAACKQAFHLLDPSNVLPGAGPQGTDLLIYSDSGWPYVIDGLGHKIDAFLPPANSAQDWGNVPGRPDDYGYGYYVRPGDFDGDGHGEVLISDRRFAWIFKTPRRNSPLPKGEGTDVETTSRVANRSAEAGATPPFAIVDAGKPHATIAVARDASGGELFAAQELQTYIAKSSGVTLPMRKDDETFEGNIIAVGRNKFNVDYEPDLNKRGKDTYRMKIDGKVASLVGVDDDGTQYAVYAFLEKHLGIRWLWPGQLGEVVPKMPTIAVGQIDETQKPDFVWRNRGPGGALWGAATGPTEMHARARLLGITPEHQREVELWEKRNKWGGVKVYGGHVLGEIFTPDKFAKTHPEYYSLVGGRRAVPSMNYDFKHGGQVCTTNPEVIEVTVKWVRDFFDKHPEYDAVHISMNDGHGFCQCNKCRALDSDQILKEKGIEAEEAQPSNERNNSITDRIFTFANAVAAEVQKTHPGKHVMNLAYSQYILPPERIELHPFVIPQYALWSAYRYADPKLKRNQEAMTARWKQASRHAGIYEYYINGSWPSLHRIVVRHIAGSLKTLHQQGYDYYQTQSDDGFAINGINYYVAGRMLWDSSLDEAALRDDFYRAGFGRAADAVKRFHHRLIDAWDRATASGQDIVCDSFSKAEKLARLFTPELLQACRGDLDQADRLADDERILARIAFYRKGLKYTELTLDAVRATLSLRQFGIDAGSSKDALQRLKQADRERAHQMLAAALDSWRKRDAYVEEVKNDYVLGYFWIKYNDARRGFNPTKWLETLR